MAWDSNQTAGIKVFSSTLNNGEDTLTATELNRQKVNAINSGLDFSSFSSFFSSVVNSVNNDTGLKINQKPDKKTLLGKLDLGSNLFLQTQPPVSLRNASGRPQDVQYENPYKLYSSALLSQINNYQWRMNTAVSELLEPMIFGEVTRKQTKKSGGGGGRKSRGRGRGNSKKTAGATQGATKKEEKTTSGAIDTDMRSMGGVVTEVGATMSIMNPLFSVPAVGADMDIPSLNDAETQSFSIQGIDVAFPGKSDNGKNYAPTWNESPPRKVHYRTNDQHLKRDITNCSIKSLVGTSNRKNSSLGLGTYRYQDFMYCKDLGKISNNHLLTLRKFSHPVGDNIFKFSSPSSKSKFSNPDVKGHATKGDFSMSPDVGRLVTWFGNEDNKLENIMSMEMSATWKPLESKIEQVDTNADSEQGGILGSLLNSANPSYNQYQAGGFAGTQNIAAKIGGYLSSSTSLGRTFNSALGIDLGKGGPYANHKCLTNYDENKIYTPKNTVQDTHIYEGKIKFSQSISIVFRYRLRAYANINPKAAMLDLMGNILEVTHRRGKFWGGSRKFIGPPQNTSGWKKANAMIDNAWDKVGGFLESLTSGSFDFGALLGQFSSFISGIGSAVKDTVNSIKDAASSGTLFDQAKEKAKEMTTWAVDGIKKFDAKTGFSKALKGQLKNALGRPQIYAMNSLLSGDNVGLWHLTVGNPKNPIAAFGNLILDNASVKFIEPLGIDDFPSEIVVTCNLKHGRSRDATEVSRMFTKGINSIYLGMASKPLSNYVGNSIGFSPEQEEERNLRIYQENHMSKKEKEDLRKKMAKEKLEAAKKKDDENAKNGNGKDADSKKSDDKDKDTKKPANKKK